MVHKPLPGVLADGADGILALSPGDKTGLQSPLEANGNIFGRVSGKPKAVRYVQEN